MRIYVRGNDLGLYTATIIAGGTSGFTPFTPRGGVLYSTPRVVADGSGVRLYLRGSDSKLWTTRWASSGAFGAFTALGGNILFDPGVTFDGAATRFFVVNADGSLSTGTVDAAGTFSGFVGLGGFITAVPAAAAGL